MLSVALKEWAVVCDLLMAGELAIVLRKGGIHEVGGPGRFSLEYPRFALWPSWAHQQPAMIKPPLRDRVEVMPEPASVELRAMAEAAAIWQVPSRAAFDRLDDLHCWSPAQIDMRFNYKPERPIYLMALRAYRLATPRQVQNKPGYAGCRSWVPLEAGDAVDDTGATPAMPNGAFDALVQRAAEAMQAPGDA